MLEHRAPGGPIDRLSPRERATLAGMAEGRSNAAIARDLDISEASLQRHISSIFATLGLPRDGDFGEKPPAA